MNDDRNIPWKRISVEAAAIVASILLAFWIDASWERYQDRREEYEILLGLNEEFSRYVTSIEDSIQQVEQISGAIGTLLNQDAEDIAGIESIETIEGALFHSIRTTPPDEITGGVRDALFESGKLDLIRNDELREALVRWPASVNQLEQQRSAVLNYVMQTLLPYLSSTGVPLTEIRLPGGLRLADRQLSLEDLESGYRALLADQEFLNLLAARNWWALGTILDYKGAAERAGYIVELTEAEIQLAE